MKRSQESMASVLRDLRHLALGKTSVFVSATSSMKAEALALVAELPPETYRPYWYDHEQAPNGEYPRELCAYEIARCDVFLPIIGPHAGSRTTKGDQSSPFVVHWEYCEAIGRDSNMPAIHTYWNPNLSGLQIEDESHKEFVSLAVDFDSPWAKSFTSPPEFAKLARERLAVWLQKKREAVDRRPRRIAASYALAAMTVIGVLDLIVVFLCIYRLLPPLDGLVAITVSLIIMPLLGWLLYLFLTWET